MRSGGRAAGLAALAALTLSASSARATVVTLGQPNLSASGSEAFTCGHAECLGDETFMQFSSAGVDVAPAPGVITSWGVDGRGHLSLQVLERTGEFFVGAGTSEEATNREGAQNPTELGIDTGDRIAVDTPDLGGDEVLVTREASASLLSYSPAVVGTHRAEDPTKYSERRLLLNAQEELAPVVTSVSPGSGSTAGGNTVLITGKYLDSAINVVFGSRPATTFSVDLAGEHITATAPASNAGAVDVHVSNLHSTSETVAADRYTFVAPSGPGSGSSPPPGGGGPGNGGTGPVVTGFKQSAARWRRGSALPHISSVPVGTTFAFGLNETANVSLSFVRVAAGRRVGGKCVAPSPRNRNRAKCRRNVTAGTLPVAGHAGLDKVRFQGHLSRAKQLSPGSYTVSIAARGAKGSRRLTRSLAFTILP